jgi:hypothetical protein
MFAVNSTESWRVQIVSIFAPFEAENQLVNFGTVTPGNIHRGPLALPSWVASPSLEGELILANGFLTAAWRRVQLIAQALSGKLA